ncbi:50S ribosomal protein L25 [bacterium]|nr:50S ribosomal protein L25 [bacterium]|tara:strand:- start:19 stop:663 length:645 start_codon:yes stop_codon:yes gene_type:complete
MAFKLEVEKRDKGVAPELRAAGNIPAVVYGPKQEPISLVINKIHFEKLLQEAGESSIVNLEGLDEEMEVLIQDVAFNAEKGGVEHVDFYAIERGKELTTNVALHFEGESPATKNGATVIKVLHELEVTCRPSDLPSEVIVDISKLIDENSVITVGDLEIGESVTVSEETEAVVATIAAAREEEPETVPESVPEVDASDSVAEAEASATEEESEG